jgi:putative endonuclease
VSRDHQYFVYIVRCSDGLYYTGVTNDVERRIWEHNEGIHENSFTFKRRPVELMYWEKFADINQAISWEKQLKGWSRKKKEALFKGDWEQIVLLSKNREGRNQSSTGLPLPKRLRAGRLRLTMG